MVLELAGHLRGQSSEDSPTEGAVSSFAKGNGFQPSEEEVNCCEIGGAGPDGKAEGSASNWRHGASVNTPRKSRRAGNAGAESHVMSAACSQQQSVRVT